MKSNTPHATRHDPAFGTQLAGAFAAGASDTGATKGSQAQYKRESRNVALGSQNTQPALHGMFAHPIPAHKGDRW